MEDPKNSFMKGLYTTCSGVYLCLPLAKLSSEFSQGPKGPIPDYIPALNKQIVARFYINVGPVNFLSISYKLLNLLPIGKADYKF